MRGLVRRWCGWICAAALCFSAVGASAEFSPLFASLMGGAGLHADVTGSFEALAPLTDASLDTVNEWLSRIRLSLDAGADAEAAEAYLDGEGLFSVSVQHTAEGVLTAFWPSGGAYWTAGGPDALQLLAGGGGCLIPSPTVLPGLYARLAEPLYALLAEYVTPKAIQDSTSVKNALSSASYVNYVFKDGELNAAWPRVLDVLLPLLREALADQPAWLAAAEGYLSTMEFYGECRFKRMLDKNGGDMGMQFTGQASAEGLDKRKVTLFGGSTPGRGGYVSLSLPAVSGKNTLKFSFGAKLTQTDGMNTLTFDGAFSRTLNGDSASAEWEGTLKNNQKNGGEQWSGKATLSTAVNGAKAAWTITPALEARDGSLAGTVAVQKKVGSAVKWKATIQVVLSPSAGQAPLPADNAVDLRGMDQAVARACVLGEEAPLYQALLRLMAALPEKERSLLTHDLRTDAWMNGPLAPAGAQEPQYDDPMEAWIVVEEE